MERKPSLHEIIITFCGCFGLSYLDSPFTRPESESDYAKRKQSKEKGGREEKIKRRNARGGGNISPQTFSLTLLTNLEYINNSWWRRKTPFQEDHRPG